MQTGGSVQPDRIADPSVLARIIGQQDGDLFLSRRSFSKIGPASRQIGHMTDSVQPGLIADEVRLQQCIVSERVLERDSSGDDSTKNTLTHDALLQTDLVRYQPRLDRIRHVADLTRSWANLRKTPPAQKKIAILLANYPSKNARIGNAVGLDTPASLHALLEALWKA